MGNVFCLAIRGIALERGLLLILNNKFSNYIFIFSLNSMLPLLLYASVSYMFMTWNKSHKNQVALNALCPLALLSFFGYIATSLLMMVWSPS